MTSNADAAEIFRTIADLLDLLGEKFKPEAYRRAARSIESLTEPLAAVASRGELRAIPGVGEAIAEKIQEYLRTGTIPYYERLKREVPPGLVELMRLPGLGPKTARRFWVELQVEGPNELRDAIGAGRLDGLKGFGPKKIDQMRTALAEAAAGPGPTRRPIEEVYPIARSLVASLRKGAVVDRIEVAGSFRRARETVGDLDILVTSKDPPTVFSRFSSNPLVAEVRMRGETKETVLLTGGLQVDLRVVKPEEFGAALQYFTGSKDHNVRLRTLARDRGLKVNEYGVFRGDDRVAGATEEEVYASLGLAWIPPELREDRGEIDAAAKGAVPSLVGENDLRGDLHVHLGTRTTREELTRLVAEARARHLEYVGVVVGGHEADGSVWALPGPVRAQLAEEHSADLSILTAVETVGGPVPKELGPIPADYRILRPATGTLEARPDAGHGGTLALIAHLGAAVARDPSAFDRWVELGKSQGAALEIGPGPERIDSVAGRRAREGGARFHLPLGLGNGPDDPTSAVALGFARRAGASSLEVTNARALSEISIGRPGSTPPPRATSSGLRRERSGKRRPA